MSIIYKKNQLSFLLLIALFLFVILQPQCALAQNDELANSPISRGLCNVFELANGNIGKAVAIFAIVAVGFGFFTGKFSIALVIGITLGIGILFGAPKIITALTGGNTINCADINDGSGVACPFYSNLTTSTNLSWGSEPIERTLSYYGSELGKLSCATSGTDYNVYFTPSADMIGVTFAQIGTFNNISGEKNPNYDASITTKTRITTVPVSTTSLTLTIKASSLCRPSPMNGITATWKTPTCTSSQIVAISGIVSSGTLTAYCAEISVADSLIISNTHSSDAIPSASSLNAAALDTHARSSTISGTFPINVSVGYPTSIRYFNLNNGIGNEKKLSLICDSGLWKIKAEKTVTPALTTYTTPYNFVK
jgi:type IV secretory pathway VirB2 component (pilin)